MRTLLISYDLAKPNRNKHVVAQEIMGLGTSWARPLEQTWYVRSDIREEEAQTRLARLLDIDDGLLIQVVKDDAVLTNASLRWFRQRRAPIEMADDTNVVPFPAPPAPPADQGELFARAS
jgi:hypothetical protein